jgi:ABC-type multidrug transport system ATPase subunit
VIIASGLVFMAAVAPAAPLVMPAPLFRSTHIVDDIAQTCREVAVLAKGRLIFRGTVEALTGRAEGRVWSVVTDGPSPQAARSSRGWRTATWP